MGSLNGDVVVMRNGRSTSQVSIYNYPEHLNPFYEDDQHKRLRFWKISKKDNEGRRNSFSIGNLKDMWAFKSFRLKKKSSTLGITKTSESPPPLRREYMVDSGWKSFDHRLRDSRTSSVNGDNFQRNATYRSSLQTLPSNNDRIGFNRNDDYRSTIQVPRPNPRYHQPQKPQTQPRRSSQSSMISSNPFESDIDDDNEVVHGMRSATDGGSTSTLSKLTPRKKRRAPAPPTPIHGSSNRTETPTIVIESSQNDTQNDLCIREDTDIANLTAEIESFVKDKSNEDIETSIVINERQTPKATSKTAAAKNVDVQENVKTTTVIITTNSAPAPAPAHAKDTNNSSVVGGKPETHLEVKTSTPSKQEQLQTIGQEKAEISTVKTATTSTVSANGQANSAPAAESHKSEKVVKGELINEVKSNGAIPKKPHTTEAQTLTNRVDNTDLCIAESSEQQQRPVPVQRTSKSETEVGHVECIHVHVESPRATPREEHAANSVTSFKKEPKVETVEIITTKTPFILTSPPRQRKSVQQTEVTKETVKIVREQQPTASNELTINEPKPKPEIMPKPALSPKPIIERNGKLHTFAEIHKPMRNKGTYTANGHVRRASREETVAAPTVPQQHDEPQQVEETIRDATSTPKIEVEPRKTEKHVSISDPEVPITDLKIEEIRPAAKEQRNEIPSTTSQSPPPTVSTIAEDEVVERRETNANAQLESLYRPQSHMEWKRSTLAPLETNIPPEKRKSVKDIIESINRSQRLLHAAANKDFTIVTGHPATSAQNTDNCDENLRILDQSQREIRRMVEQIDHLDNAIDVATTSNGTRSPSSDPPSYSECIAAQKLDNSEIFQKCKVKKEVYDYRESSPISSNLDWNPVPKPKRTKPQHE